MSDIKKLSLRDIMEVKKHIDAGNFKVKIVGVKENEDGSGTVNVEMSEEFMNWFKEQQGLKRWSNKRFHKFFTQTFQKYLNSSLQTEK
mgnify:CR=1 FL=1|tara:strand:- start:1647 stop:1910 length:264 start_codon:yes stop_codon:yes gene_type:complete